MQRRLVAGVDCSTQATKVIIVDIETGEAVAAGRVANPVVRQGPASETDPEHWWKALAEGLAITGRAGEVAAISIAAQQLGLVTLDSAGLPLRRAILWDDTRSAHAALALRGALGGAQAWADLVGPQPMAGLSVASWAWLRAAEPEIAARTRFIRLPHDFLTERLTGNGGTTDRGDASATGWWSSRRESYVPEVLDLDDVRLDPAMLPRVLGPDEAAGTVTRRAAAHTGLRAGIPVACGTGDNMAAALALGIRPGAPVISLGTSGTAYTRSNRAPADPTGQVFADASASGDHLPLACSLNATLAVDNIARLLGRQREDVAENTRVVVMPYLSGERLPDYPHARGGVVGIDHETSPGEVLLAAYEGVAFSLVSSLDAVHNHSGGIDPDAPLILVGGGAKGAVWQRTIGRLSGLRLVVPDRDELAAWGAATQAAATITGERSVDIARRWKIAEGTERPALPRDVETTDHIARVRAAAHELNAAELFS